MFFGESKIPGVDHRTNSRFFLWKYFHRTIDPSFYLLGSSKIRIFELVTPNWGIMQNWSLLCIENFHWNFSHKSLSQIFSHHWLQNESIACFKPFWKWIQSDRKICMRVKNFLQILALIFICDPIKKVRLCQSLLYNLLISVTKGLSVWQTVIFRRLEY